MKKLSVIAAVLILAAAAAWCGTVWQKNRMRPVASAGMVLTREAVVQRIHELNRLESSAFYIDTIIQTKKRGHWYMLWQDSQAGLFVAKGRVLAGVDLSKLNESNVQPLDDTVILTMPPVEILSVDLDNLEVYDLKTGSLGLHPIDKAVFGEVQQKAKQQVLDKACKAGILEQAKAGGAAA